MGFMIFMESEDEMTKKAKKPDFLQNRPITLEIGLQDGSTIKFSGINLSISTEIMPIGEMVFDSSPLYPKKNAAKKRGKGK